MANEEPLVLQDCGYNNLDMQYTPSNLWSLSSCLEEQWNNTAVKLAQLKNSIEDINSLRVRRKDVSAAYQKKYNIVPSFKKKTRNKLNDQHESKRPRTDDDDDEEELMLWRDALKMLGGVEAAPGVRKSHIPLMQREGAKV